MDVVEQLVRSFARQISKDGKVALTSSGHPALAAGFQHLGWSDPYIDPTLLPPVILAPTPEPKPEPKPIVQPVKGTR